MFIIQLCFLLNYIDIYADYINTVQNLSFNNNNNEQHVLVTINHNHCNFF